MCLIGESESGHGGRFEPCEECKRLQEENATLRQDRDRLAGIVEKADALAKHQIRECEACSNPCMAYGLARMYQETRHG